MLLIFFCKQKTAYEMRISDWSSDVCSSDLLVLSDQAVEAVEGGVFNRLGHRWAAGLLEPPDELLACGARYRTDGSGHQAGEKVDGTAVLDERSEEHTSELQSLMRSSYAVFCLKKKTRASSGPKANSVISSN